MVGRRRSPRGECVSTRVLVWCLLAPSRGGVLLLGEIREQRPKPHAGAWVELCLPAQLSPCRDRWPMRSPSPTPVPVCLPRSPWDGDDGGDDGGGDGGGEKPTAFRPSGVPEVRCPHYSLSDPTVTTGCSRCLPSWAGPRGFGLADSALSFAALARHCNKEAGSHVPGTSRPSPPPAC